MPTSQTPHKIMVGIYGKDLRALLKDVITNITLNTILISSAGQHVNCKHSSLFTGKTVPKLNLSDVYVGQPF